MNKIKVLNERYLHQIVLTLRIIIGATFVLSGIVKAIDLWGFTYKIEQYLNVWSIYLPHSLILFTATIISFGEFILGALLFTGSYKRSSVWILLSIMAFMLPLSAYIAIVNPVEDCGCFGDFWKISNVATLIKNIFITGGLIYLLFFNKSVLGLYSKYIQWVQIVLLLMYISIISYEGYSVQPLLDFRPYKIGTTILPDLSEEESNIYKFIYEKDGKRETFSINNLPDSSWTFIDREEYTENVINYGLSIYKEGEDVTNEAILASGDEIILIIPNITDVNISYTYLINEINRYAESIGGRFIGLLTTDDKGLNDWQDISLATYNLYSVEDTSLKEVVRGQMSLVYLKDGKIQWKRTIRSINASLFSSTEYTHPLETLYINGYKRFIILSASLLGFMLILWIINRSGYIVKWHFYRKNKNNIVTLQKGND